MLFFFLIDCPKNWYGEDCKTKCPCSGHGSCDVDNGKCFCDDGYQGKMCNQSKIHIRLR